MTLDDYLEEHCECLRQAVKAVPAGKDLPPIFAFEKDGVLGIAPANFAASLGKADAIALFRAFLRAIGAERYAIVAAAWIVQVSREEVAAATELINRDGTTAYRDRRRECYQVVAGDRERTLFATFDVERDYKGKIRRLVRCSGPGTVASFGRMVDLLLDQARH